MSAHTPIPLAPQMLEVQRELAEQDPVPLAEQPVDWFLVGSIYIIALIHGVMLALSFEPTWFSL